MIRVEHFAAGNHSSPVKQVEFSYNELGRLVAYDDGTTTGVYTYDDLQRKLSETVDYGTFSATIGYSYYANGLKQSFTDPAGETTAYRFDAANRLAAIEIPSQGQVTYKSYRWNRCLGARNQAWVRARRRSSGMPSQGLIFASSELSTRSATSVSCMTWARSQYPLERPKKRHSRKSVSAVMARLPATMSPMRCAGTPISLARRYWLIAMGFKNSSSKSSPGVTGLSLRIFLLHQW